MTLSDARKAKGYSQSDLSKISGVSIRMIQGYEQGSKDFSKANVNTVFLLAQALDVTVEDLIKSYINTI